MVSRGGGEDEIIRWEKLLELRDTKRKEAEFTKSFWESAGRMTDFLRYFFTLFKINLNLRIISLQN